MIYQLEYEETHNTMSLHTLKNTVTSGDQKMLSGNISHLLARRWLF